MEMVAKAPPNSERERAVARLEAVLAVDDLPIRPETARRCLVPDPEVPDVVRLSVPPESVTDLDPGWTLRQLRDEGDPDPTWLAEARWWPARPIPGLARLWRRAILIRRAVAESLRKADVFQDHELERLALLVESGLWAWASADPESWTTWCRLDDPHRRADFERRALGIPLLELHRRRAERWDLEDLAEFWRRGPGGSFDDPRLDRLARAVRSADQSPWRWSRALPTIQPGSRSRGLRRLVGQVRSETEGRFVDSDRGHHDLPVIRALARAVAQFDDHARRDHLQRVVCEAYARLDEPGSWSDWLNALQTLGDQVLGIDSCRVVESSGPDRPTDHGSLEPGPTTRPSERQAHWDIPIGSKRWVCVSWVATDPRTHAILHETDLMDRYRDLIRQAWRRHRERVADRSRLAVEEAVREASVDASTVDARHGWLAEFAAGAGHELNNPLAVVQGRAQLIGQRSDDAQIQRMAALIVQQVQRAHRILRDLIVIARPPRPHWRRVRPGTLLERVVEDCRPLAESRGVELQLDTGTADLDWIGDPDLMRHAGAIVVRNAIEASERGKLVRIEQRVAKSGLRWRVRDEGPGLEEADQQRIFDPFYCGRQAGRGLGLGLPRLATIARSVGARLQVDSRPAVGTRVSILWPRHESSMTGQNKYKLSEHVGAAI